MESGIPMGLRFSIIGRSFKQQLDELLREKELTGVQFGVLGQLGRLEHSGCVEISQRDLENASHVTHPTMTEILKRLEKKDFIRCRPSESDRRCKLISSTEKAAALIGELRSADEKVFASLTAGLRGDEVAELLRLTDVMLKNTCGKGKENE